MALIFLIAMSSTLLIMPTKAEDPVWVLGYNFTPTNDGRPLIGNWAYASNGWRKTGYLIQDTSRYHWNRIRIG